jgi:hypothetical protein
MLGVILHSGDHVLLNRIEKLFLFIEFLDRFVGFARRYFNHVANKFAVGHRANNCSVQIFESVTDLIFVRTGMDHD